MDRSMIQNWTDSAVPLKSGENFDVRYSVYCEGDTYFLEMRERDDDAHIHTLQLPDGIKLDRASYEVLLRYVLVDVIAA